MVPTLVSRTVELFLLNSKRGGVAYKGSLPLVVVVGVFDHVNRVLDVLNAFATRSYKIVFLARNEAPPTVKVIYYDSIHASYVTFLQGSALVNLYLTIE